MSDKIEPTKSVRIINIITKVLYVISIVILVLAAIGIISGITWCIYLLVNKDKPVGEEQIYLWLKIITESSKHGGRGTNIYTLALLALNSAIYSLGISYIAYSAIKYFKANIKDQTPFTSRGGKGLIRLGLVNIITGLAVMIICAICYAIFFNVFKNDYRLGLEGEVHYIGFGWTGLGLGIIFIIISLFINAFNENNTNKERKINK